MERSVFVESIERDDDDAIVAAKGIVEMVGVEVRWEAWKRPGEERWTARLLPGQFDEETEGLAGLFLYNPPLGYDIEAEIRRAPGHPVSVAP